MFHISLSHYAGNYGLSKEENDPTEALRWRMESMKIVNERLDDHSAALSDGTMGTVASLSSYEVSIDSSSVTVTIETMRRLSNFRLRMDLFWQPKRI